MARLPGRSLVLVGGVAGGGYFGYQFFQSRFGEAPDFAGGGTSQTVTVEIAKGSGGYEIGQELKSAGVVKSVDAFVSAQSANPKGSDPGRRLSPQEGDVG